MEKVLISIVSHNSSDLFRTLDCLQREVGQDERFEVVVYDNASEESYREKLRKYQFIRLIEASENLGFGHGHNQVLLNTSSKYAFICNPDIIATLIIR